MYVYIYTYEVYERRVKSTMGKDDVKGRRGRRSEKRKGHVEPADSIG